MNRKVKDIATTIAGGIGAAAIAAQPIVEASQGNFTKPVVTQLIFAAALAVIGWFTGKKTV